MAGTRILLEPVESTWEPVAGNVNAPECLVSADDKSINNQSLVSIVKFLLYYHMSSAELKDRGKSLGAESAKRKWFLLGSNYYRGGGFAWITWQTTAPQCVVYQSIRNKRQEVLVF